MPDQSETIQKLSVPRYAPRLEPTAIPEPAWNDAPLLCLQVNDEWVSHILGVMIALDQPDAWIGTEEEIFLARQQVNEIMLAFMEVCGDMSGCDCEYPLVRIQDGVYQESDDDGETWHDAPTHDPRNSIPRIPPIPSPESENSQCAYADSVINHFKEGFVDILEEGQTAEELLGFLTAIMEAIFGPLTGPIGWIIPAIFAISTAIVAIGVSAVAAAFTDDVWSELRCLIYNNINADGSFTKAQIDAIYAGIPGGAIVEVVIRSWIAAIGATGMTNAAHLGLGSSSAICCPECSADNWSIVNFSGVNVGAILSSGSNWIIVEGSSHPDFGTPWNAMIQTAGNDICCTPISIEWLTGDHAGENNFGVTCGAARWPGSSNGPVDIGVGEYNTLYLRKDSGSGFTAKITFS